MTEISLVLTNKLGLHGRPAADLAKLASKYKCKILLKGNKKLADARSIISVLSLGIREGQLLTIIVEGQDEEDCIAAFKELVENNFYES